MASAVIRAMSFGALSSSSSSDDHRGRGDPDAPSSRSSSKNRNSFSKTLSRESTLELDDSLGLERSLSRLSLVSSAGGPRAPGGGILINRSRPSSPNPPTTRSLSYETEQPTISTSAGSSSSMTSDRAGRPLPPIRTHSSTSSTASANEPLTPSSPGFAGPPQSLPTNLVREESIERKKPSIKFAPLPQIRPRSYSTGRNVWAEHDEEGMDDLGGDFAIDDDSGPLGGRHLVRREDGRRVPYDEDGLDDEDDDYDLDDEGGGSKFNPRRQSWTDTLGMGSVWGLNGSANGHKRDKSREIDEDAVSLGSSAGNGSDYGLSSSGGRERDSGGVSKILKPFLFGRKKSTKPSSKSSNTLAPDENGAGLSRQSSGESQVSRRSISNDTTPGPPTPTNQGTRPKGTTGIPMRKASTWDSTNSGGSNTTATTKSKSMKRQSIAASTTSPPASLPRDPSTPQIIYYASPSRSARPARRAQYPPVAQRSRTAPKPIRQTKVEEPEFSEWGSVGSVGSVGSRSAAGRSAAEDDEDGSGMAWIRRRRKEREEKEKQERELALAQASSAPELSKPLEERSVQQEEQEDKENAVVQRAISRNPKRQSTVDSTFSVTSSTSTIRPSSPKIMSGLSLSRPVETNSPARPGSPEAELEPAEAEAEEEEEAPSDDESEEEEDEEEEDSDKEEEADKEEEDDDDDLDPEELAQEEALADAARRTAKGAGAERYHSTTHENVLHVPNDSAKR
ncbi:hypothetical protein JCM3766R1_006889 [Sporobolomyces carnicolor]